MYGMYIRSCAELFCSKMCKNVCFFVFDLLVLVHRLAIKWYWDSLWWEVVNESEEALSSRRRRSPSYGGILVRYFNAGADHTDIIVSKRSYMTPISHLSNDQRMMVTMRIAAKEQRAVFFQSPAREALLLCVSKQNSMKKGRMGGYTQLAKLKNKVYSGRES